MTNPVLMPGIPVAEPPTAGGSGGGVATTPKTIAMLRQTKPWVRFISILTFISAALMIIIGLVMGMAGMAGGAPGSIILLIFYPLLGLLYFFPGLFLFRYANRIRDFMNSSHNQFLDAALEAQKSFWKFVGILTMVSIILSILFVFLGIVAGILGATAAANF